MQEKRKRATADSSKDSTRAPTSVPSSLASEGTPVRPNGEASPDAAHGTSPAADSPAHVDGSQTLQSSSDHSSPASIQVSATAINSQQNSITHSQSVPVDPAPLSNGKAATPSSTGLGALTPQADSAGNLPPQSQSMGHAARQDDDVSSTAATAGSSELGSAAALPESNHAARGPAAGAAAGVSAAAEAAAAAPADADASQGVKNGDYKALANVLGLLLDECTTMSSQAADRVGQGLSIFWRRLLYAMCRAMHIPPCLLPAVMRHGSSMLA